MKIETSPSTLNTPRPNQFFKLGIVWA